MNESDPISPDSARKTAENVAETFFGVRPDKASRQRAVRQFLTGAVTCAILIPFLFYLSFHEVGWLGWNTTIFFVVYCLLAAIGIYFLPRTEYHTPVSLKGGWADRVGAFWLVCCAFGPVAGWAITSLFPITLGTWRWLYGSRVFLAAGLPLITSIPLIRYLRGRAILVALPLLVVITMLPVLSTVNVSRDLWEGPIVQQDLSNGYLELYLDHTKQSLGYIH
jgi:hypothetical protein